MKYLTKSYTIWCSECPDWQTFEVKTQQDCKKRAEKAGWFAGHQLALCPTCFKSQGDSK